jgi:hypothetical protein
MAMGALTPRLGRPRGLARRRALERDVAAQRGMAQFLFHFSSNFSPKTRTKLHPSANSKVVDSDLLQFSQKLAYVLLTI